MTFYVVCLVLFTFFLGLLCSLVGALLGMLILDMPLLGASVGSGIGMGSLAIHWYVEG